jgi:tetratricopeptide (TPR) repeat protein
MEDYRAAKEVLNKDDEYSLYLLALSEKHLDEHQISLDHLDQYLAGPKPLQFEEEAIFEKGLNQFALKKYEEAKEIFKRPWNKKNLQLLAEIYIIKIDLANGKAKEIDLNWHKLHERLDALVPKDDPLNSELYYLQAQVNMQLHHYNEAISWFERAATQKNSSWKKETQYQIGLCNLKISQDSSRSDEEKQTALLSAEKIFKSLLNAEPSEKVVLAAAEMHLTRAKQSNDPKAYLEAEDLLSNYESLLSPDARSHALLLHAEAAPSYEKRNKLYKELTSPKNAKSVFYGKGWYMKGLNDYEAATLSPSKKNALYKEATASFAKAFEELAEDDPALALNAKKYEAEIIGKTNHKEAFELLDHLIKEKALLLQQSNLSDEIYYLHGFYAEKMADSIDSPYYKISERSLLLASNDPHGTLQGEALKHLAAMNYKLGNYEKALEYYLKLAQDFPSSPLSGEALFFAAESLEKIGNHPAEVKALRKQVYTDYPASTLADAAYFTSYSYTDYLQGDKEAIKHLQQLPKLFPNSPYVIEESFLLGLNDKRDRKSPEGKWISKRNLTAAIDAFQQAEHQYDTLISQQMIDESKIAYYTEVKRRATLERAIANLAIADESQGAKREIYLQYAEEVFLSLITDSPTSVFEESALHLAETYVKKNQDDKADKILDQMIAYHEKLGTLKGYYPTMVWYEKGKIAMRAALKDNSQDLYNESLKYFKQAEESYLGTDLRLDLWIQESQCYVGLEQYDAAILILSKVVNDPAISSLRVKAMYLRAIAYEKQGRKELARKQLESMLKKGGLWSQKAQEKLDKEYGH